MLKNVNDWKQPKTVKTVDDDEEEAAIEEEENE